MSSFMLRSGYAELAKKVHSISGSVTTIFLFTRLWARSSRHGGLWRDDYILIAAWACLLVSNGLAAASPVYGFNVLDGTAHGVTIQFSAVCFMDVAIALSKTAFATTLLRLTRGRRDKAILWATIVVVNSFNLAMVVANWLDICETLYEYSGLPGRCVTMATVVWIHTGNAISCLLADIILTVYPWRIIRKVTYVSDKEKWSVAVGMGLVGLSMLVGIVKIALMSLIPSADHGKVDYTYGVIAVGCAMQGEAAISIVAQTIPVLRVLIQPGDSSAAASLRRRSSPSSRQATTTTATKAKGGGGDGDPAGPRGRVQSIALVQLPTGRIVPADSDEGRALQRQQEEEAAAAAATATAPPEAVAPPVEQLAARAEDREEAVGREVPRGTMTTIDDEVHKIWEEMGLSRRAWSKSPSPGLRDSLPVGSAI